MSWLTPPTRPVSTEDWINAVNGGLGDALAGTGAPTAGGTGIADIVPTAAPLATAGLPPGTPLAPTMDPAQLEELARQAALEAHAANPPIMPIDNSIRTAEQGRYATADMGLAAAEQNRDQARARNDAAMAAEQRATLATADAESSTSAAKAALLGEANEQASRDMGEFRADRAVMMREANQAKKKADYLADQAAHAEMRDFWADKSTGARIAGIIAQTLSGAANGLAGQPGAPSPLDRIIDRDFELQKRNLAHKTESAQAAAGALGQIYNSFSNKQQAFSAMQAAMAKKVEMEVTEMSANFDSATAKSRAQAAIAQMKQKAAQHSEDVANIDVSQKTQEKANAAGNLTQMRGQDIQANMFGQRENKDYREIPGLSGMYHKDAAPEAFKKKMGSYGATLSSLEDMRSTIHDPAGYANWIKGKSVESLLRGEARNVLGVGANVQGKEAADMEAIIQSFVKGKTIEQVTPQLVDQMIDALEASTGSNMRGFVGGYVPGARFDEAHPTFGRALQLSRPRQAPPVAAPK